MPKTSSECSDEEVSRYLKVYSSTRKSLQNTRIALERRKLSTDASNEELDEIEVQLLWLASELAKLKQRRTAFLSRSAAIQPPSEELVETVKGLTGETEQLTANAAGARSAVVLATKSLEAFGTIQGELSGA